MKLKNCLKLISSILLFFYISFFVGIFIKYVLKLKLSNNYVTLSILDFIISLLITVILIIINKKFLKEELKKKIDKDVLVNDIILFMVVKISLAIITTLISNLLGINVEESNNQNIINAYFNAMPLLIIISASILAPISEEILFRSTFRETIRNKKVFVLVSGLIFGLMHITDNLIILFTILLIGIIVDNIGNKKLSVVFVILTVLLSIGCLSLEYGNIITKITTLNVSELLNSITYIGLGIYLAYIYVKRDNIIHNILVHAFNNAFSVVLFFFL